MLPVSTFVEHSSWLAINLNVFSGMEWWALKERKPTPSFFLVDVSGQGEIIQTFTSEGCRI